MSRGQPRREEQQQQGLSWMNLDTIKGAGTSATSTSGQGRQQQKPWKVPKRSDDKKAEGKSALEDSGIQLRA